MPSPTTEINILATDKATGETRDTSMLQDAGVAFDPTQVHLDLTKEEKRRTTALLLAIQAYEKLIIKDAEMYNAISRDRERDHAPRIQPATMDAMVSAALNFDDFISGELQKRIASQQQEEVSPAKEEAPQE